jgi:uncharacterized protein (TIGR02147 family)
VNSSSQKAQKSYVDVLRNELAGRRERNKSYSQRAFARDIGIAPNHLSEVLRGKRGISGLQAEQIASKLRFKAANVQHFRDLAESCHARSEAERQIAKERLRQWESSIEYNPLSLDAFKVIEDWFHFAILEITKIQSFKPSISWVSEKFNLPFSRVKEAVCRLERLGLLKMVPGRWQLTKNDNVLPADIPSPSIRKAHTQLLHKAIQSLDEQSVNEREFVSLMVAVSEDDIPEIKKKIRDFISSCDAELSRKRNKKSQVFVLGVQFFNLSTGGKC